jgi:1,4-dihydroxy-2-naphthoate octaprenyltransferase
LSNQRISKLFATARPAFLILTPCCLLLAPAFAVAAGHGIDYIDLIWVFVGGLAAHISVNMFNEYEDFRSGLDFQTQRTPFSGGSGTLPADPELAKAVQTCAILSLLLTIAIGIYFITQRGWGLLPIGLLGVICVYFYTGKITHSPWLCLIAPGLSFGPLMINGAYYVLTGQYNSAVFSTSLIVFCLVNNLLLLNQFPDQQADQQAGRCHLPILLGKQKSAWVYAGFLAAAYAVLIVNIGLGSLPTYSLLGLLTLFLALPAAQIALKYYDSLEKIQPAMGMNVALTLLTPVLVATGLFLQHFLPV